MKKENLIEYLIVGGTILSLFVTIAWLIISSLNVVHDNILMLMR